jgi:hypothetical protein
MRHLALAFALALPTLLGACGGAAEALPVEVRPMPEDGTFTGVWNSPQIGELHMVQTGQSVIGEYRRNERRGQIQGRVTGDVMRFEWRQERSLVPGRPSVRTGRGYFQFEVGGDERHYILGRWGHGESMLDGGEWRAVRNRTREPELSSESGGTSGDDDVELDDREDSVDYQSDDVPE